VAGVASGASQRFCVDANVIRCVLVVMTLASGVGLVVYVLAWLLVPAEGTEAPIAGRALADRRGVALALAVLSVAITVLVTLDVFGVGVLAPFSWSLPLAAAGLVLVWRDADEEERGRLHEVARPLEQLGLTAGRSRRTTVLRVVAGLVLAGAGAGFLVHGHPGARLLFPVAAGLLVLGGFLLVFGPWWASLARELMVERTARLRAEERAEMAARVHDSVLQTLALIQRSSGDPQRVMQLARAQERELRSWLFEGRPPGSLDQAGVTTLAAGVAAIEREVEAAHGVAVEAVTVGDCPLDAGIEALLAAGREAAVNAAKWSGAPVVSLFAEVEPDKVSLFVHDRGKGFDPGAVAGDRRGLSESIRARMARAGGLAAVRSSPGEGTDVELSLPRARP
jgi:signal transduction histidine kinase